ncbi:MAG: hypothetical protein AB1505_33110 [Candidatus Latescibacterota bacterium]
MPLLVERIAKHDCTGHAEGLPDVVRQFCAETGTAVDLRAYPAWDAPPQDLPPHVADMLARIRAGSAPNEGFFLNGRWLPTSPHCAHETAAARAALAQAAGLRAEAGQVALSMRTLESAAMRSSVVGTLRVDDSAIAELGAFCNQIERAWFFDGHIGRLSVASQVDELHYAGYDVVKLVRLAEQHPELFAAARLATGAPDGGRPSIEEIRVRLLTQDDLQAGRHPCVITDGGLDPASAPHRACCERVGGWGYVALLGERPCGFLGIAPKDVAQQDAGFCPPSDTPADRTLLLTCFAGGGVFGAQYGGIGVATKLATQAVSDARTRGYCCVEGNPHDPGIGRVLERCGFARRLAGGRGESAARPRVLPAAAVGAPRLPGLLQRRHPVVWCTTVRGHRRPRS